MGNPIVADVILQVLADAGVKYIFSIPGGVINTMVDAIRRQDRIKMIHVRHEEAGAFAASAQAKLTGELAVCMGTSGPGAIHLLNGLYDAKLDHAPVLALTGQVETKFEGSDYHQEINTMSLFENVAVYNQQILSNEQVPAIVEEAVRAAHFNRSVAQLSMPMDVVIREVAHSGARNKLITKKPIIKPEAEDLEEAADVLNRSNNIVILAGAGAYGAADELVSVAEKLKAPIVKALRGKDILPDDHPYVIGGLGLLGTKPGYEAVKDCDTLLMVGTDFPYVEFLPKDKMVVQIDINGNQLGKRLPVEVGLIGDSKITLEALLPLLKNKENKFLEHAQKNMADWWKDLEKIEKSTDVPMRPQAVAAAVSRLAEDNAIFCCDTGDVTVWGARNIRIRKGQRFILSGSLASMAFGLPAAIGAKLLYPDRQVIALCGDGGFGMIMGDFLTAVQYKLKIIVVIFNNHKLGMIKAEEEVMGLPEYETHLHNPDFAEYAKICGGDGIKITSPEELDGAIYKAMQSELPFIIDAEIRQEELPYPPRITAKQAFGFAKAKVKEFFGEGDQE